MNDTTNRIDPKAGAEFPSLSEITFHSSADGTSQPALFHAPSVREPVPLVVALHTWLGNYRQKAHPGVAAWCCSNGWAYMQPDFRGSNTRPEACGSQLAVDDIVSAVDYARQNASIDANAMFLVGGSGGGHASLLMAGRHPEIWAGVSSWVPIFDLKDWHDQDRYRVHLEQCCGGAPGTSSAIDEQYRLRSPRSYLSSATGAGVNLSINAGIHDGYTGSVPISHTLLAFNAVAHPGDRLTPDEIRYFVEEQAVPPHLRSEITDPTYGTRQPLFRRTSGKAVVTIFEGGHESVDSAVIAWFRRLRDKQ